MTRIVAISDTHAVSIKAFPKALVDDIKGADVVVHCGDYTSIALLNELRDMSKRFVGVYGNMDALAVKQELPRKTEFEADGKRIGVIHPYWGGDAAGVEERIVGEFRGVDAILYGHTHKALHMMIDGVQFINPGQSCSDRLMNVTAGIINVGPNWFEMTIKSY